jgi:predicted DNA-binding WGR domain protein
MKKIKTILYIIILSIVWAINSSAQQYVDKNGKMLFRVYMTPEHEKIYCSELHTLYVFPKLVFKNKSQEKFYWKTVRDVKVALPYARIVAYTLNQANADLEKLPNDDARKKYLKDLESQVRKRYEPDLREMTNKNV